MTSFAQNALNTDDFEWDGFKFFIGNVSEFVQFHSVFFPFSILHDIHHTIVDIYIRYSFLFFISYDNLCFLRAFANFICNGFEFHFIFICHINFCIVCFILFWCEKKWFLFQIRNEMNDIVISYCTFIKYYWFCSQNSF